MNAEMDLLRRVARLEAALETTRATEPLAPRLPFAQRILNPFPLASSGGVFCDFPQSRAVVLLAFCVSVFVNGTNNGTNYWTIALINTAGTTLASVTTSAIGATTWTRLVASSITQPASANVALSVLLTATLSPGPIFLVPELIVA